ncbi:MAG: ATP-grasp domain-containing protein [Candidatus Babeliales bacterium]
MKNILVVRPSKQDQRELSQFSDRYNFIYHTYTQQEADEIFYQPTSNLCRCVDELVELYRSKKIDGVLYATDYIGTALGAIVAQKLGLTGPDPATILLCQHKYESRNAQKEHVPESVADYFSFDIRDFKNAFTQAQFPLFIKPIKSVFSINASQVNSLADVEHAINNREFDEYPHLFEQFIKYYTSYSYDPYHFIAESLLQGSQCTLEGFCHNGQVTILGIVDSIMYPGTISFQRFEYPSSLPMAAQERMGVITRRFIAGVGLDNSFFNIEFMYNPQMESIHIIEVNPRIASQFSDLYEKIDGKNSYELLIELVTGQQPVILLLQGSYRVAASFVLRVFADHRVEKIPTSDQIALFHRLFPAARFEVCCSEGEKLSSCMQDGKSYRYGLMHLGAQSWQELYTSFEEAKKILKFNLEPV